MSEPLALIAGVVRELAVQAGEEEFIRSMGQRPAIGGGVAVALAAAELPGAAVSASMAATSAGDAVEFFACRLGEQRISGCFSKVSFKDGDELTVVAQRRPGAQDLAIAARRRQDSTLWMAPHCARGSRAHAGFSLRVFVGVLTALLCVLGGAFGLMDMLSDNRYGPKFTQFWLALVAGLSLLMAGYFSIRFYFQWLPLSRQAEQIFAALGYADPAGVDLPREHKLYCKVHGVKWPYPSDGPWIYRYLSNRT